MKKRTRAVLLLLVASIICSFMTSFVSAEREPYMYSGIRDEIKDYDELFFRIYDNVIYGAEVVNISTFRLEDKYLITLFDDLLSSSPELYYLVSKLSYSYTTKNDKNYISYLRFHFNMTPREMKDARRVYDKEVEYIASLVDPSLSEVEKVLYVYDYMLALYEYDTDMVVYDAYRMLTGEKGVCRAYSLTFVAVMRKLGIECIMVTSNDMVHAWNLVRIDGVWYHLDLTYDDPQNDRPGRVLHDYFLLTDDEISNREVGAHYNWKTSLVCDTPYSGERFWSGTQARTVFIDGIRYCIDTESASVMAYLPDGSFEEIYKFENRWYTNRNRKNMWVGVFSGLSDHEGMLIINTDREIIAIDPATKEQTVLLTAAENEQFCGSAVHKGDVKYYVTFNPGGGDDAVVKRAAITEEMLRGEAEGSKPADNDTAEDALPFEDVQKDSKYYSSIEYVYENGLFNGVSATAFAPNSSLTRAMFVTVLGRLFEVDTAKYESSTFTDVPTGQWYSAYVSWAAESGIVNGVGGGKFNPDGQITREQMAKVAATAARILTGDNAGSKESLSFTDSDSISAWAIDSVKYCVEHGLIDNQSADFNPKSNATRAESADIIARLAEMIN